MRESRIFTLLVLVLAAIGGAFAADPLLAKPIRVDAVEVEMVADTQAFNAGASFKLGLRIRHDPHWHTYWRNPGDSGLPTVFAPKANGAGFEFGEIQWPAPQRLKVGPLLNFGYEGELLLPVTVKVPADLAPGTYSFSAQAQWLVCKDVCIPGEALVTLSLPLQVGDIATPGAKSTTKPITKPSAWQSLFEATAARTPREVLVMQADIAEQGKGRQLLLRHPAVSAGQQAAAQLEFFPYAEGLIANAAPQLWNNGKVAGEPAQVLEIVLADGVDRTKLDAAGLFGQAAGVLVRDGQAFELLAKPAAFGRDWQRGEAIASPAASAGSSAAADSPLSFGIALLFAALGGLILNLMPCVFPVIGLKVLGFVDQGKQVPRAALRSSLFFAAGVLVSFWVLAGLLLALRSAGQTLGWGFQLQSPWFVAAMALLFVVIGLNLSGLFEFGVSMTRLGAPAHDTAGTVSSAGISSATSSIRHFSSGALAVLVATPCTAPFMGSALGYTLSQPTAPTLAVFSAMGLGMALPYIVLGAFPGWITWLPKSGRWMESLKQFLAFPMYATAVWLGWVLVQQAGPDAVLALGGATILLSLAAWIYGRFIQTATRTNLRAWFALLVSVACAAWAASPILREPQPAGFTAGSAAAESSVTSGLRTTTSATGKARWGIWSPEAVEQSLAQGHPVLVDFTAAWCVSCQANKLLVLERETVINAMRAKNVVGLRADWTQRNPKITAALAAFGRNGVPLYVLYKPGASSPTVLPELLTQTIVLQALASL